MAGILLCLLQEGIVFDHRLPIRDGADEELRLETKALASGVFQTIFQFGAGSTVVAKQQIAALENGSNVLQTEFRKHLAQIGHANFVVSWQVHSSDERNVCRHWRASYSDKD